ncbi:MAG: glycoside hydrolase family 57 protein [bacterium]
MNNPQKKKLCFYLQLHQPYRLSDFSIFDIDSQKDYFNGSTQTNNQELFNRISDRSYLPMAHLMYRMSEEFGVKWSISMSGLWIEQAEKYRPDVLMAFERLVKYGNVEILGETYYHSLASIKSKRDFAEQVQMHTKKVRSVFALFPQVFRNTELIYSNEIANFVYEMGFDGMLSEGWDLGMKSPNILYKAKKFELNEQDREIIDYVFHRIRKPKELKVLLRNYQLTDDIGFRFVDKTWSEYPLTADKYTSWLESAEGDILNIFMDFETFGEHLWNDTGIFEFIYNLAKYSHDKLDWVTVSEAIKELTPKEEIDIHNTISWADMERDLSAWLGNKMQQNAFEDIYEIEERVKEAVLYLRKTPDKKKLMDTWRKLQSSDHFYYMSTKNWSDGNIHKYFSPYESPYKAFINYMNILQDFRRKISTLSE